MKMIKDDGRKYDDYSISPKIRQILLHWGYELTEKDFLMSLHDLEKHDLLSNPIP